MLDILSKNISKGDFVVYIRNDRGENPRLIYATVEAEGERSIIVRFPNDETHSLHHSHRSYVDKRMNNLVIVPPRPEMEGEPLDFTEYPISIGDKVAFMEAPSQGFSTSLVLGEVLRISADGITIVVRSKVEQKYFRKPNEVVVIEHSRV